YNADMTLSEAVYFSEFQHYKPYRNLILSASPKNNRHRLLLEEAYTTYQRFDFQMGSSIRRLEPFFDSTLSLMFGGDIGVDFTKMIAERWVILVDLYSGLGFEPVHSRLLGSIILNELFLSMDRLIGHNEKHGRKYNIPFFLYIDEAGQYATRKLAHMLNFKAKSNFRVTVACQYFKQFEDPLVLDALLNCCKNKFMFNTPNP